MLYPTPLVAGSACNIEPALRTLPGFSLQPLPKTSTMVVWYDTWMYLSCIQPFQKVGKGREADQLVTEVDMSSSSPTFLKLLLEERRSGGEDTLVR